MFQTFSKLYQAKLSSPSGFFRLTSSILMSGANLMAILRFSARTHGANLAVVDDKEEINYNDLYQESMLLAANLQKEYQLKTGKKVALICRNHIPLVKALFALSYLGADVYLLNIEMSKEQLEQLLEKYDFDVIVYDIEIWEMILKSNFKKEKLLSQHLTFPNIQDLSKKKSKEKIKVQKGSGGKLVTLTGGTTGVSKAAVRKPSVFGFLNPFFALLNRMDLAKYNSVHIATPVYHGFGLAALIMSVVLGAKILLTKRFDQNKTGTLLLKHRIQVLIVVPLMLHRLVERSKLDWLYVRCVLSGGAALSPALAENIFQKPKCGIANLYGTSEAGFCIMADTEDLKKYPNTLGKKIKGASIKIFNEQQEEQAVGKVGRLHVKSGWTMSNKKEDWVNSGDLAYQNEEGYFFLCGRADDMIVSGGENVYPIELENVLMRHEAISQVAVIGIPDAEFGQRLKAFIVLKPKYQLDAADLLEWLKDKIARYQMPKEIAFLVELPTTAVGKIDKKKLMI